MWKGLKCKYIDQGILAVLLTNHTGCLMALQLRAIIPLPPPLSPLSLRGWIHSPPSLTFPHSPLLQIFHTVKFHSVASTCIMFTLHLNVCHSLRHMTYILAYF